MRMPIEKTKKHLFRKGWNGFQNGKLQGRHSQYCMLSLLIGLFLTAAPQILFIWVMAGSAAQPGCWEFEKDRWEKEEKLWPAATELSQSQAFQISSFAFFFANEHIVFFWPWQWKLCLNVRTLSFYAKQIQIFFFLSSLKPAWDTFTHLFKTYRTVSIVLLFTK